MRRAIVAALAVSIAVFVAACGGTASAPTSSTQPPATSVATVKATPSTVPTQVNASQTTSSLNPCNIVKSTDLSTTFQAQSVTQVTGDGVDPNNPPTNLGDERNCGYIVTVSGLFGDNPADTTYQFTVMVTTYGDNNSDTVWKIASQGQLPVTGIGDGAFYGSSSGDLTFRKGGAIVRIWSVDDTNGMLNSSTLAGLASLALPRITG